MTNNLDEFEQPDLESNGEPPAASGMRANLSHAWRTRPLFKFLVLIIAVGAITAVSINLFSSKPIGESSKLPSPPQGFRQPPGGAASPYFNDQTKKANETRVDAALNTGGSAIVTPIGQEKSIDEMTDAEKQKKDPLVELRNQLQSQKQEIAQMKQQQQQQPVQQAPPKPPEQFDESLAQAMQKEMQKLSGEWDPHGLTQVAVSKEDEAEKKVAEANGQGATSAGASASDASATAETTTAAPPTFRAPIISAGTVSYAQLLTEANSDVPGPILAQIVSGPLSGARAVGEFKVANDYLVLHFSLASLKGKDYMIDAIALDPDTTLGGMATEVDHRYFTRVLLPAAAGFVQGFGQALGQNSSSVVTNGDTTIVQQSGKGLQQGMFQGLSQAGQTMGQFFENEADQTKPLVRVAAGTPMGFFFVSSVCSFAGCSNQSPAEYQTPGPGTPGYSGSGLGQPMTGYSGYGGQTPPGYPGGMAAAGYGGYNGYGGYSGQTPGGYSGSVPYTNTATPYTVSTPGYGGGYSGATPGTYGIGTPVVNP